jgi:capsid assembly protease
MISHVLSHVVEQPWALRPVTLSLMRSILVRKHLGHRLEPADIAAVTAKRTPRASERFFDPNTDQFYAPAWDAEGDFVGYRSETTGKPMEQRATVISILGVLGVIAQRAAQVDDISGPGGTSVERLTQRFRAALADQAVRAIVLDIDSPGGGVYGVEELAEEIRAARGQKPIVAVANSLAASAAYWIASAADEVVVTPSGQVGSIGVYAAHEDISKFLENEGIKETLIFSGKYKVEGNPFEPLTDEARASIQKDVATYYGSFVRAVAKGRGASPAAVEKGFGQGRVVGAKEAVEEKMADRVETLDAAVRRVGSGKKGSSRAESSDPERSAAADRYGLL